MTITKRNEPIIISNNVHVLVCDRVGCESSFKHDDGSEIYTNPEGWWYISHTRKGERFTDAYRERYDFCSLNCLKIFMETYEPVSVPATT